MDAPLTLSAAETHEAVFRDLLRRHESRLSRVASAFSHRAADREDLLQDIAVALWTALPKFRGECSEQTFIYRVAHNTALKYALKKRWPLSGASVEVECSALGAEATLVTQSEQERLRRAVRGLPIGEREIVVLALEDLSHSEIADVTGLRENVVAVRLFRAKARLRAILGASRDGEKS